MSAGRRDVGRVRVTLSHMHMTRRAYADSWPLPEPIQSKSAYLPSWVVSSSSRVGFATWGGLPVLTMWDSVPPVILWECSHTEGVARHAKGEPIHSRNGMVFEVSNLSP
jgi:hypothetical protein